ncbi:uroporphyrinogen decarboxylase [Pelagibacterium halotolerans]|uniref:Uroporphyrinogen decarboxylase n=1 Tax=Pelagibacterium halotolerans (strain DSM 22347 / JCM 15775 / CGMCC 1.7692 / B2) TaxID=1082931 RepID=G4R7Q8_PELHB|nr:uroporphyrinogen III decarboxylase [Pelagibacterium halotolerans B2]SEA63124.1 uroporphyrinogen decarboxylase [Pelagibacterium halotolerans]
MHSPSPTISTGKPLLDTALGLKQNRPPVWIMRQAGRYLPEYRAVREKAGSFLDLCYTPALATEVTLQPLRRFDLDAAILFSDILVIPHALGQPVRFAQGEGPVLDPIDETTLSTLKPEKALDNLDMVLEAIERIKLALSENKTLIGFCGAPWTVATYMIGGRGSPDQAAARLFALNHPKAFAALIDILVEVSARYLIAQFRAGADMVQLFESWALNLDEEAFRSHVIEPNRRIIEKVRSFIPDAPITGFPRGAAGMLAEYAEKTGVSVLGLDFATPLDFASSNLPKTLPVQGNLDPLRLVAGGAQMEKRANAIIEAFADRPHIFNLGHGIVPQTPIAHVSRLVDLVHGR